VKAMSSFVEDIEGEGEQAVGRFIDRLASLPPDDWLIAGAVAKETAAKRIEPIRTLEWLITSRRLGMSAWRATDGVATAAYLAFPSCRPTKSRMPELAARRAAEVAAHALLARRCLSISEFALLYLPFLTLIPPELP
jgi:hypothetical protein